MAASNQAGPVEDKVFVQIVDFAREAVNGAITAIIRFSMDRSRFEPYFETMDTFGIPGTQAFRDHPLGRNDPKTAVFPETLAAARQVGHAGPPGRKATEVLSKYLIVICSFTPMGVPARPGKGKAPG
jgi:hypothetical protein